MNYEYALKTYVDWEKNVKPIILAGLEYHKRNIAYSRKIVNETRSENLQDEETEDHIKTYLAETKFSLTGAKCYTYMHNKDYENAVKYFELFKVLCYERIEDTDLDEVQDSENSYTNEYAYIKLCNSVKQELEEIELIIQCVSIIKNVSVILKAGRKMNKRKNRNNNKA